MGGRARKAQGGLMAGKSTRSPLRRFNEKWVPEPNSGCWLWAGSLCRNGYGSFGMPGGSTAAHRASWTLHYGPIPDGMSVLHRCDTRGCVNPTHLFLGTQADNMADMRRKGREARGDRHGLRRHPEAASRGESRWNARLNRDAVRAIRSLAAHGMSIGEIARGRGLRHQHVSKIVARKIWSHA